MATEDEAPAPSGERMRLVASLRGNAITLAQPGFVLVLELPNLEPIAELGIPGDLDDHDLGYNDDGGRLAVLSRGSKTSTLHVVDPTGPTKLGEVELRGSARMVVMAGSHALVHANNGMFVVDISADKLTATALPVRGNFTVAGRLGPDRFVLAIGGALEEWDANKRAPGRRLRLDQALDPLYVGGNALQIWMVPKKHPEMIDVISLAARSTRRIELPEPVAHIAPHPNGYLLAAIGAISRNAFVVDMSRAKTVARVDGGAMTDVAWIGRNATLVIKPVGAAMELVTIAPGDAPIDSTARDEELSTPEDVDVRPPPPVTEPPPTQWTRDDIAARLAAWREKHTGKAEWPEEALASLAKTTAQPTDKARNAPQEMISTSRIAMPDATADWRGETGSGSWAIPTNDPEMIEVPRNEAIKPVATLRADEDTVDEVAGWRTASRDDVGGWRAELARWAQSTSAHRTRPAADGLDAIATRLGLTDKTRHALALLYGAYLGGARITRLDLANALEWDWKEALGGAALAATDLVRWRDSDIRLRRELLAALDDRPPLHGSIAPAMAAAAMGAVAIVAPAEIDPARVGAWAAPSVGALLVPDERGRRNGRAFVREARIRGLTPLVRWADFADVLRVPPQPGAVVVEHPTTAASLQLPVVATWSA